MASNDFIERLPKPFQDVLSEIYTGKLEPLLNRQADDLNNFAHSMILNWSTWGKTATGQRIYTTDQIDSEIDGQEVRYSLMAERTLRLDDKYVRTIKRAVTLAINGDFYQPAAIFVPPVSENISATIVVGSHINETQHIDEVQGILQTMDSTFSAERLAARKASGLE